MANTVELKNIENFIIKDEFGSQYYGGCDVWYADNKHKEIGNGAAVLSTMLAYIHRGWEYFDSLCSFNPKRKETFIKYMYDVLQFVSPGLIGIMAGDLRKGAKKYAESRGFVFTSTEFSIPGPKMNRPEYRAMIQFIHDALSRDVPVGFINLGSGRVKNMTPNHWVIIVGLDAEEGILDVIDNGKRFNIDFKKWLKKSSMGGSFAIVEPEFEDDED